MSSIPKVSVMILTYNHEKFIGQAIEGILNQKTNFSIEINVVEDCSTDGTRDVIRKYHEKHPDKINLYFNKVNVGSTGGTMQMVTHEGFKTLKGQYIAILDGDDYWSTPDKLQKQVDFLDANPEYAACGHNVIKIYDDNSREPHRFLYWEGMKEVVTFQDLVAMTSFFHISTLLYRNVLRGIPNKHFADRHSCEIYITMVHSLYGPIRRFDEDMSVYRAHAGGGFSTMPVLKGRMFNLEGLRRYNRWFHYKYCRSFSKTIVRLIEDLFLQIELGNCQKMSNWQKFKYTNLLKFYSAVLWGFDFYDTIAIWYNETVVFLNKLRSPTRVVRAIKVYRYFKPPFPRSLGQRGPEKR